MAADSEHVEILRRGPRAWNAWRLQHPTAVPILTRISLSASERQMGRMNGGPINLASARLRRASLRFATLSGANLAAADLSGADLSDARLDGANLTNADLSQAVLDGTDLAGATLLGANLRGTNLTAARNLTAAQLAECVGDAATDLPAHLERPRSWTAIEADPERPTGNGESLPRSEVATRSRVGAMSWLVGNTDAAEAAKLK